MTNPNGREDALRIRRLFATSVVFFGGGIALYKLLAAAKQSKKPQKQKSDNTQRKKSTGLNGEFVQRLLRLLREMVPSLWSRETAHMAALVALIGTRTLLQSYAHSVSGSVIATLFKVSSNGGTDNKAYVFGKEMARFTAIQLALSAVWPAISYLTNRLSADWRARLTHAVHRRYVDSMMYYKLANLDPRHRIENADQRITQDIERLAGAVASLFTDAVQPLADVIVYTQRLYALTGAQGPATVYVYMAAALLLIQAVTPHFGQLVAEQQQLEGRFRQLHARTAAAAEPIAMYRGDQYEHSLLAGSFERLTNHASSILQQSLLFGVWNGFFSKYLSHTIVSLVLGFPIFFGSLKQFASAKSSGPESSADKNDSMAVIAGQLRYALAILQAEFGALAKLIGLYRKLMQLSGYTARVSELFEAIDAIDARDKDPKRPADCPLPADEPYREGRFEAGDRIRFVDVAIYTPDYKLLAKDVTFEVTPGKNVLITGPNGAGKSSLFRVLGGLWPLHSGVVVKPGVGSATGLYQDIYYVPQKPYNVIGSLRDQIAYPIQAKDVTKSDDELRELLRLVGIEHLATQQNANGGSAFDRVERWNTLSLGEQQRMAMARLFFHSPRFAILDECTSGVTADAERALYEECRRRGITCITISHRPALYAFHDNLLLFDGEGGWTLTPIDHNNLPNEY